MVSENTSNGLWDLVFDLAPTQQQVTARGLADLALQFSSFLHLCLILLSPFSSDHFRNMKKPWSLPCMTTKQTTPRSWRCSAMRSTTWWTVLRFTGGEFKTGMGKAPLWLLSSIWGEVGAKEVLGALSCLLAWPLHWVRRGEPRQKEKEGRSNWGVSCCSSEVAGRQPLAIIASCTPSSFPSP